MSVMAVGIEAIERGLVPDRLTRLAIRRLCGQRLSDSPWRTELEREAQLAELVAAMHCAPVAPVPDKANEQHYELPAEFFDAVLGPRRKYSCCYWADAPRSMELSEMSAGLAEAEDAALRITCQRAELIDGQDILELGCGWGSLSLWMAEYYPGSRVTAVSNSASQRRFIEQQARSRGLNNLRVITADMNDLCGMPPAWTAASFDRVISVEMFEHMRNYDRLLQTIAAWLRPDGRLFVHIFCHRQLAYEFQTGGTSNWMGRHFFTGGLMPSEDLLRRFDRHLRVIAQHTWNGRHYQWTAEAWLAHLDARQSEVMPILSAVYGRTQARRWFHRWRVFFLAVAEMFGYDQGEQWYVSHYLLQPV